VETTSEIKEEDSDHREDDGSVKLRAGRREGSLGLPGRVTFKVVV
jgi:hypothetical protein